MRIGQRREWLNVQGIDAPVPIHLRLPGQVEQRRRIAEAELVVEPVTEPVLVSGKSGILLMTGSTGKVAVLRQAAIIKESATEFEPGPGEPVRIKRVFRWGK